MTGDAINDLELQLKKRARRRLVGAIALVLLMIIVLPIALHDRSAQQNKPEVTITIPNDTKPVQHENNLVNDASKAVAVEEKANTTQTNDVTTVVDKSIVANEKQVQQVQEEKSPPTKSHTKAETKRLEINAAEKNSELKNEDETKNNLKYYVQIGVFSDADNVKKLQTKLSDIGYKSQSEKISTDKGEKIRLRTSIFKERNEAAIALENIKSSGMAGIVVSQK
ncbi:MAG: SPOR domain-containing protein [Methylophilaceae bacterium]|nr:SPOR domain-containing protein [Methylophilaceae bacterium]